MRSIYRSFMAAILLTAAAGICLAQQPNTAPPPAAPPVVKPVAELPPMPVAIAKVPAVAPAVPAVAPAVPAVAPATEVQSAPLVEPVVSAVVDPPVALKPATTTIKHVVKKTNKKPAAKPVVEMTESVKTVAPAASIVAVEPPANTPPADAAAIAAHPATVAPAQPAPALKAAAVETSSEVTKSDREMGLGGWLLFGIGVVALFGGITLIRRRRANAQTHRSITDFTPTTGELELQPALARRP